MATTPNAKKKIQGDLVAPGWRYPPEVIAELQQWCDRLSLKYEAEAGAAILVWPKIPSDVREAVKEAMSCRDEAEAKQFWADFAAAVETIVPTLRQLRSRTKRE